MAVKHADLQTFQHMAPRKPGWQERMHEQVQYKFNEHNSVAGGLRAISCANLEITVALEPRLEPRASLVPTYSCIP